MNQKYLLIGGVILVILVVGYLGRHTIKTMLMGPQTPSASQVTTNPPANPQASTTASQNTVTIKNFAFSPATMTIKVGETVTWTNQDSAGHSATADDNSFDTGVLSSGQSGSTIFGKAGTYTYHCSIHPNMKATITVQ